MPSAFRNWKTLPEWLQLDYFRRRRTLGRLKSLLVWGTLLGVAGLAAAAYFAPGSRLWLQAAPVSDAHTFFNADCARCHGTAFQTARRLFVWDGTVRAVANESCVQCHDGPAHNSWQLVDLDCAACHREHRGRKALARVPDSDCTACHADLKANSSRGEESRYQDVTRFPDGHPEFALWRGADPLAPDGTDPGRVRFNHKVHLAPDGVRGPDGQPEVLDCAVCHQADVAGRYMLPIRYADHCARCHALSVRLTGRFSSPRLQKAAEAFAAVPAPHPEPNETPAVVRATLRDRLVRFAQENRVVVGEDSDDRPFPKPPRAQAVSDQEWTWADRELSRMEKLLFHNAQLPEAERALFGLPGGCAYCHVPKAPQAAQPAGELPDYLPTNIRARWMPHARFRHDSHRMLVCTECHNARESSATADVLMPRVGLCAACHNARVGARSDCAECHRYHQRERGYDPDKDWTIREAVGHR